MTGKVTANMVLLAPDTSLWLLLISYPNQCQEHAGPTTQVLRMGTMYLMLGSETKAGGSKRQTFLRNW